MKIGLVGEAPNDTQSIKNLLQKNYPTLDFVFMLQRINGANLDSQKTKRFLRIEFESQRPDIVVFIRDLDAILPNNTKLYERKEYFTSSNRVVDKKGIPLLNIYEIEALILADIESFNRIFSASIPTVENVMFIAQPKEYLKRGAKKYNEAKNAEIFNELSFENVFNNCEYFKRFVNDFNKLLP